MTKDLTKGEPMKLILSFTLPILLGLLFQQFYNMVDAMIVGKLLGAQALGAVGATGSINFFVIGFCTGVCSGFAIPVAQRVGAGELSKVRRYVANAAYLSGLFSLVLVVVTGVLCEQILTAMLTPEDIFQDSYRYIFIIFMGIPATFLYNLLAGIIRSLGDSRTPVYFLALASGLNVVLDLVLILYCRAGVGGAALATVISQAVSGLACLFYMVKKFPDLRMTREERRLDLHSCWVLCTMGIPMGLQYSITAIGCIILQSAVNTLGSVCVSAVTAGGKLYQLLACPFDAMGSAMATYCGQNVGACKLDRLKRGIQSCSLLGLVYSGIALVLAILFARQGAMLFLDPKEPELLLLQELTSQYIVVTIAFFFPLALVNILRFSIQGMGFGTFAILAGVFEMVARTVVGHFCVPIWGYTAACLAAPAAWILADLFLIPACLGCISHLRRLYPSEREEPSAQAVGIPVRAAAGR